MMRMTMRRALGPLTALALGCGGDGIGPGDVGDGEFSFEVTETGGDFHQTVTGSALWAVGAGEQTGFAIDLTDGERATIIGRESTAAPAVGTYQLGSTDAETIPPDQFIAFVVLGSQFSFCGSQSGTMQVTSTGEHVRGTFTANISCFEPSSNSVKDAVVTGEFDAVQAPQQ